MSLKHCNPFNAIITNCRWLPPAVAAAALLVATLLNFLEQSLGAGTMAEETGGADAVASKGQSAGRDTGQGSLGGPAAEAQSRLLLYDELPYRINALICFDRERQLSDRFRHTVIGRFVTYASRYVGDAWRLHCTDAGDTLAARSYAEIDALAPAMVRPWAKGVDKVFVLGVQPHGDRYLLAAREYDVTFNWWGPTVKEQVSEAGQVPRELLRMAARVFAPLARMEEGDSRRVRIRVRGGRLPCLDTDLGTAGGKQRPPFLFVRPGDLFRPLFRQFKEDDNGDRILVGIRPVAWTFYRLENYKAGKGTCRVYSALRNPLPSRSRDPLESHMLLVRTAGGSTELRLIDRVDRTPLGAVDILVRESVTGVPMPIGTTDMNGRIQIEPLRPGTNLLIVFVRHGGTILAKLPIVPGAGPEPELALRPDPVRLQIEGYVLPIQEEIIDLVAKRKILEQRIRATIKKKDWKLAEELIKKLKQMPSKDQMLAKLEHVRQVADEMRGEGIPQTPKVRRILGETGQAIEVFFDPDAFLDLVDELEDRLADERDQAEQAQQAKR